MSACAASEACAELSSCLIGAGLAEVMRCVHLAHYCTQTIATTDTLLVTGLTGLAERSASALPLYKAGATDGGASYIVQPDMPSEPLAPSAPTAPEHGTMLVVPYGAIETIGPTGLTALTTQKHAVRRKGTVWTVYSDVELRRAVAAIAVAIVVAVFAHLVLS